MGKLSEGKQATIEELIPIMDYVTLRAVKPYLKDNATITDYLQTQNIDITPDAFPAYYSNLEKEALSLISSNPEARNFYLKFGNYSSIKKQINEISSYGPKYLEKRFKQSLLHTYNSVVKTGFSYSDLILKVKKEYGRPDITLNCLNEQGGFSDKRAHFDIIKEPWGTFPRMGIKFNAFSFADNLNYTDHYTFEHLFKIYWNSFLDGEEQAGKQIQRIIQLEDDIQLHLIKKKERMDQIFGEK